MRGTNHGGRDTAAWRLTGEQHGVLARRQLLGLGFSPREIERRVQRGRLLPVFRGVYAVGRREITEKGHWMAAVLACGESACLSHRSAGALHGICAERNGVVEISVRRSGRIERPGVRSRSRPSLPRREVGTVDRIPLTSPVQTMIDLAVELPDALLLRTVNEADKLGAIAADVLRSELAAHAGVPGVKRLVALLDRDSFVLTEDELERLFLPLARAAGLALPRTAANLNGFEVDFFWPELGLIVETDGLRYHRTAATQARDARRDQAHTAAGYTRLRFTHRQVRHEPSYVARILAETASRITSRGASGLRGAGAAPS